MQSKTIKQIVTIDESIREIAALDELHTEIVSSKIIDEKELLVKKEEAKFARLRMLKLSLNIRKILEELEATEGVN